MTGRRAILNSSTVCSIERALLDPCFVHLFIFIEGNAVGKINLNYSTYMKSLHIKIVKKLLFETKRLFLKKYLLTEKTYKKIFFLEKNLVWEKIFSENFF